MRVLITLIKAGQNGCALMMTFGGKGNSLKKAFGGKDGYELEIQKVARLRCWSRWISALGISYI